MKTGHLAKQKVIDGIKEKIGGDKTMKKRIIRVLVYWFLSIVVAGNLYSQNETRIDNRSESIGAVKGKDEEFKKYKIEIYPKKILKGIEKGHVIAYGHYIKPPYEVVIEENSKVSIENKYRILINGVEVLPGLPPPQTKKIKLSAEKEKMYKGHKETTEKLTTQYKKWKKEHGEEKALEMTIKLAKKQHNIESARKLDDMPESIWIKWKDYKYEGGICFWESPKRSPEEIEKNIKDTMDSEKNSYEESLRDGDTLIFTFYGFYGDYGNFIDNLKKIMDETSGNEERKLKMKNILHLNDDVINTLIYNYTREEYK